MENNKLEQAAEDCQEQMAQEHPNSSWDCADVRNAFKAGAEWQKQRDELTWQDIAEIWHIVEDLYDSGDYTGDAAYLFYNEALEKFKEYKKAKK